MLLAKLVSLCIIKLPRGGQTANGTLLRRHAMPEGDPRRLVQGSKAWLAARREYITASEAGAALGLIGAYACSGDVYARLFHELNGDTLEETALTQGNANMVRGQMLESKARRLYMRTIGFSTTVSTTGLHAHARGQVAASPDALLGKPDAPEGLLKIKVPKEKTKGPGLTPSRLAQIQVQMACTGAKFTNYATLYENKHNHFQLGVIRVNRDERTIAVIVEGLMKFHDEARQDEDPPECDPRYNARLQVTSSE